MQRAVCVFLALCIASSLAINLEDKQRFLDFQLKFGKSYNTEDEFNKRFEIFQNNMLKAAELQKQNPSATFGITKFSDMTVEEFNLYKMPPGVFNNYTRPAPKTDFSSKKVGSTGPNPTNYDWSATGCITPVYDQGQCGSCWAFSATETIESYNCLAGNKLTPLSMEQIVDCDTTDGGCNGGWPHNAYQYVQTAGGIEAGADYTYTAGNGVSGTCAYNQQDNVCTVTGWKSITGETGLYAQLSSPSGGPVSVCVDASSWQFYTGGVLTTCGTSVDHCVQLTGYYNYGQSGAYWNVRNSWNTNWGISGYIHIAIGQDLCLIGDYATVVTTSSV